MCKPKCRHCNERPVNRPRGLCIKCFYTRGVKELYPLVGYRAINGGKAHKKHDMPFRQPSPQVAAFIARMVGRAEGSDGR